MNSTRHSTAASRELDAALAAEATPSSLYKLSRPQHYRPPGSIPLRSFSPPATDVRQLYAGLSAAQSSLLSASVPQSSSTLHCVPGIAVRNGIVPSAVRAIRTYQTLYRTNLVWRIRTSVIIRPTHTSLLGIALILLFNLHKSFKGALPRNFSDKIVNVFVPLLPTIASCLI
jgi:hypothetical protein